MSKPNWTAGEWKAIRSVTCGHLRAEHNYRQDPREEWTDADICLINAAPDLYAACEAAEVYIMTTPLPVVFDGEKYRQVVQQLKDAVRKARGEA